MASVYSKLFSDSNTILETSKQVDGGISGTVEAWLLDGKAVMSVRNCSNNINHYIAVALTLSLHARRKYFGTIRR